jgi:putative sterol carrier protein
MSVEDTILSILTRIRENPECQPDIQKLQGEVLQFKITGEQEYRFAFRDGGVELDQTAAPTFHIEGQAEVMQSLFEGRLDPLAAILTRRLKITFDPVRGPLIRRIIAAGMGRNINDRDDLALNKMLGFLPLQPKETSEK